MGYFTETINAIYETKGEIKQDYALKRGIERLSGDHDIARTLRDNKETIRKQRDHYNDDRVPMRTAQDYRDREKDAYRATNHANSLMSKDGFRNDAKKSIKCTKEAFDSVIL